ncbi:LiaF transmembrane domain-containing protein [Neobacillus sp. NRS-1170]|uniref:LiaF transmembrane domain-containing protein n=1 Tax=Neobacillus sp. NRS-1170 TaxID=3233898 RepID=UPI003D2B6F0F
MRTWRVGTFSMGTSLVFLGIFLFLSKFLGLNLIQVMTGWWPILLIVLGIEILLYLFLSRQEQPVLRYDFLSIFFVGLIGTVGIVFAIMSSTGLMGKVEEVMAREERSFELPAFSYKVDDSIKRVVVRTVGSDMTVEATDAKEVSMFGTYRVQTAGKAKLLKSADDIIAANQKGDTLYLNLKGMPNQVGPFDSPGIVAGTILVPNDVKLEVLGNGDSLTLKPRNLANDWSIASTSSVVVDVPENSNLKVGVVGAQELRGKETEWKIEEKKESNVPEDTLEKNAFYQTGEGKYHINIADAYSVNLNTNQ